MQATHGSQISAIHPSQSHSDVFYNGLGIGLAAGVSGTFWVGVLALAAPAANLALTTPALAMTGIGISCVVSAALLALRRAG